MSKQTYHPARGDIIHVNFAPVLREPEFTGPHFALVISSLAFSKATGLCIALPLTTKYHHDQKLHNTNLMVQVPAIAGLSGQGWVYTHQIKTIDYRERGANFNPKSTKPTSISSSTSWAVRAYHRSLIPLPEARIANNCPTAAWSPPRWKICSRFYHVKNWPTTCTFHLSNTAAT